MSHSLRPLPGDSVPLGVINTAVSRGGEEVHSRGAWELVPYVPIPLQVLPETKQKTPVSESPDNYMGFSPPKKKREKESLKTKAQVFCDKLMLT